MAIYFDGCTEYILQELLDDGDVGDSWGYKQIYDFLKEIKTKLLPTDLCPRGEMERGFLYRKFLRKAVAKVNDYIDDRDLVLKGYSMDLMEKTMACIEDQGEISEEERVCVIVRNLLVFMENARNQGIKKKNPLAHTSKEDKKALEIKTVTVSEETIAEFRAMMDLYKEPEVEILTRPLIKESVGKVIKEDIVPDDIFSAVIQERYREIFFFAVMKKLAK